jgi:nucleoid-associated protein YgaU
MPVSPFSRYRRCEVVDVHGSPSLAVRRPPADVDPARCAQHVLVGGETLDQLARRYYGREELWWLIADANRRPDRVLPWDWHAGDVLLIPPPDAAGRTGRG